MTVVHEEEATQVYRFTGLQTQTQTQVYRFTDLCVQLRADCYKLFVAVRIHLCHPWSTESLKCFLFPKVRFLVMS